MNVRLKAPRSWGSTFIAAASTERSGSAAISAVIRSESLVATNAAGHAVVGGLARQLGGVDQVPVVAQRQAGPGLGGAERRLRVLPRRGAGRGVAGVADGEMTAQAAEGRFVEDLADQPEVLVDDDRGCRRTPRSRPPPVPGAGGRTGRNRSASRPPPPAPRHRRRHRRPEVRDSGDRGRASAVRHREAPPDSTGRSAAPAVGRITHPVGPARRSRSRPRTADRCPRKRNGHGPMASCGSNARVRERAT